METAWPEVKLRGWSCRSRAGKKRSSQLEKEVATLSEKIHHLDDMLKSQQRKVRHMIEQLQNSKSVIQKKQAELQELQELVSYLEDENLEMHDRIEHLIEAQLWKAPRFDVNCCRCSGLTPTPWNCLALNGAWQIRKPQVLMGHNSVTKTPKTNEPV
ncbi:uncharacterized protein M8220_007449 isoform 2-T2 [Acridotheres tristis]